MQKEVIRVEIVILKPEKAALVYDMTTITGRTITSDSSPGNIKASHAICTRKIISALHHSIHIHFNCSRKVNAAVRQQLLPDLSKRFVKIAQELRHFDANCKLAAIFLQQLSLRV